MNNCIPQPPLYLVMKNTWLMYRFMNDIKLNVMPIYNHCFIITKRLEILININIYLSYVNSS